MPEGFFQWFFKFFFTPPKIMPFAELIFIKLLKTKDYLFLQRMFISIKIPPFTLRRYYWCINKDLIKNIKTIFTNRFYLGTSWPRRCWSCCWGPVPGIVLIVLVQAWRNRTFENPDAHQYHWKFHGAVPEPQNKLSTSDRFKMICMALHRLVESLKEKGTWVFMT